MGRLDGWKIYSHFDEMMRLGVHRSTAWRVSRVNDSYELCPTYPKVLAAPTQISDQELFGVKNFRKRGRIPVCVAIGMCRKVYERGFEAVFTKKIVEGPDVGDVCMMRSAQPRINSHHTNLDVKMISLLAQTSLERDEEGKQICIIFDARPFLSSVGNFVRGGGFENSDLSGNAFSQPRHTEYPLRSRSVGADKWFIFSLPVEEYGLRINTKYSRESNQK